mgnify:CR=1 FL=1
MAKKKVIKDVDALEKVKINSEEIDETVEDREVVEETVEEVEESLEEDTAVEEETEEKKDKKKEKKNKEVKEDKKEGYFASVNRELKKVVWPKGGEIAKYSLAVILFCLVLCLFFVGIDLIASFVKGLFV